MAEDDALIIVDDFDDMGKVVQLYIKDTPILVLGSFDWYHGDILDKVLEDMGISSEKIKLPDGTCHAKKQGDSYRVVGMGDVVYVPEQKKIFLSGNSMGYGLGIDKEHALDVRDYLDGFEISVR